mmetsp:Transcript_8456/g.26524  ORF Transcript_8456/g.26524 Transcript_8456/m.26524 type:complete len:265 (-) Transcript_8456:522-1316(-)
MTVFSFMAKPMLPFSFSLPCMNAFCAFSLPWASLSMFSSLRVRRRSGFSAVPLNTRPLPCLRSTTYEESGDLRSNWITPFTFLTNSAPFCCTAASSRSNSCAVEAISAPPADPAVLSGSAPASPDPPADSCCITAAMADWVESGMSAPAKSSTVPHASRTASGEGAPPEMSRNAPAVRCQRSLEIHPAPTSNRPPLLGHSSWASSATRGATNSGRRARTMSSGITVAVMREPANGAMQFTRMLRLAPSRASVLVRPTIPIFMAE